MSERAISLECAGDALVGILHEPEAASRGPGVLIVVGGPQYRVGSHRQFVTMARDLAAAGYPVFRFDYRGMGDSAGELRTFEAVDDDIRVAIDAFQLELPLVHDVVVFGLCDAASAALMYAASDPRVHGLVLANPWARTDAGEARTYIRHYYGQRLFQRAFWGKVFGGAFNPRTSLRGLLQAARRARDDGHDGTAVERRYFLQRMEAGLASFGHPVLLLMSERDLTAREFDDLCNRSPSWSGLMASPYLTRVDLAGADHTFSSELSRRTASTAIIDWIKGLG